MNAQYFVFVGTVFNVARPFGTSSMC